MVKYSHEKQGKGGRLTCPNEFVQLILNLYKKLQKLVVVANAKLPANPLAKQAALLVTKFANRNKSLVMKPDALASGFLIYLSYIYNIIFFLG